MEKENGGGKRVSAAGGTFPRIHFREKRLQFDRRQASHYLRASLLCGILIVRRGMNMPELSRFAGISVYMYSEQNSPHKSPHIHAEYQGQEVVVSLDGNVLEGDLPSKKLRTLLVWMEMRQKEFQENWDLLSAGKKFFKVEPLR